MILAIIVLLITNILSIIIILHLIIQKKQDEKRLEFERIKLTNTVIQQAYDEDKATREELQKMNHDLKNSLIAIRSMVIDNNSKDLLDDLDEMIGTVKTRINYCHTGNKILDAIINEKMRIAKNYNFDFIVNVIFPANTTISSLDICSLFGNALDNALENTIDCEHPSIGIYCKKVKCFWIIKIMNTYGNSPVQRGSDFITTKDDSSMHGIGIKSMKGIVKKYDGSIDIECNKQWFIVKIMFPDSIEN
ncbi:GHKL domain-containing protein [Acetitomaculum ruminis DSM 5522]|uniref:GHKL domain-containing protein n=1 Tax=Acetitomaculum ruminis DSM 5522 TaxID=1120918 RepID=A0A1I0UZS9_9FIRM|nr:ATP-binding protein [Acetitomaculum ruminis]SFA69393.1 GHKL domain-containing protein [Acetitomaculum ruminis DSM 5522]